MNYSDIKPEPIVATSEELAELALLSKLLNGSSNGSRPQLPRLVSPDGEEIELPASVFHLLREQVYQLARGNGVRTVIFHDPLTTWQAAALLGSQVQYVNKLLDKGEIPFIQDGRLRLIRLSDAMAHKQKLSELHRQGIEELARMSQEFGLY
ncbi:MAG: excisionase family DNA-binding protein [Hormoscilla sp. SP5CHS1]|nr:excisionase family DNA-binding protein [Hormoscilla sp. SP12CHS1]MBC6453848.1 excisionase family DNA-binding protein [Hormoscilla sp. SP5CHS1]